MKVLVVADPHWSQHSSIIRQRGRVYSARLENLIESINWAENLAYSHNCSSVIYVGDFFDSCQLNSEEISALQEIKWAPISHVYLTGNHETNMSMLEYSTTDLFKLCPNSVVISKPSSFLLNDNVTEFCFLPYILERDRLPLDQYFPINTNTKRVIFSHNDLKNVSYGPFISKEGFEIEEIHSNCNLFLNGHIHHGMCVADNIINLGNLTGQNFTEDATKFDHCVALLDSDTLHINYYCNPHAFNFYKLDLTRIVSEIDLCNVISQLKHNAVVTLKVKSSFASQARNFMEEVGKKFVHTYRLIVEPESSSFVHTEDTTLEKVDHLEHFRRYVLSSIGDTDLIQSELQKVIIGGEC